MIKRYYAEMPYIEYQGEAFDFEFEGLTNDEIVEYIEDLFSGKKFKDKYGNVIQARTWDDRRDLWNAIKHNWMFHTIIDNLFTNKEIEGMIAAINRRWK